MGERSMLVQKYKDMLSGKSVIRQLSEFATARGQEIGYENVFDYSLGNPSVPVPREFTDRMIHMLATKEPLELHGYSPSLGITSVREAIAENLEKRFGLPYRKEHIFMASGAAGALAHAFRLVTEPGDEILTFAPFFPEYHPYVDLTGAVLKVVPPNLENFQINFEAFEEMLTEKVKAVLINTPNNPSGVVYSTPTLQRLADILREKSKEYGHIIYLISDEPYREIVFEGVDSPCVSYFYDNTIMCYSFSKSLSLPGERIGYVAVNPACEDAETMINMCGQISRGIGHNCPPSIIQLAVAQVLDKTADLSVYETNMNILYKELLDLGFTCVKPGGTFYIFPKALEEDAKVFSQKALKYDLVLVPGDSFGAPGYFRMAYCVDTEKVERSLEALRRFVKGIDFSNIYGVSAGACHMCSYLSRQKGRALSVSVDYLDTRRYCSLESLLTSGDLFNVDFCYHLIPEYLYPYDYETFEKYPGKAYSVVTNIETGQPEYLRVRDIRKDIDKIRASASLPLVARNVKIDGKLYLDGGISDAIPLEKSILDGNRKNIVVMTKEVGFVRKPASASQLGLIKLRYLKYPKVYELMADRHIRYNESLDYIERQEKCGQAFVIRPHIKSDVGRIEKDKDKLIALYEEGYREAEACYEDLLAYLEK